MEKNVSFCTIILVFCYQISTAQILDTIPSHTIYSYKNFEIPKRIKTEFEYSLTFYPELSDENIKIRYKKIKTTMLCRPTLWSWFRKPNSRKYLMLINQNSKKIGNAMYDSLSQKAKIGVLVHELGHIYDYKYKTTLNLLGFPLKYLTQNGKSYIEKKTDSIAVNHNAGEYVYEFSNFVFYQSNASSKYLEFKAKYYHKPEDIKRMIEAMKTNK